MTTAEVRFWRSPPFYYQQMSEPTGASTYSGKNLLNILWVTVDLPA
jgi:hypothetical protein